jgi:hypothetical protein
VLARLRNVAQEAGLSFNDILQAYVIERFLARLARSPHADTVLLKGALMLRVWGVPRARPTMDIDLLRRGVVDQRALVQLVEQCAAIDDPSDGVMFEPTTIAVESIRDATEYVGTRIRLQARLDNVRQTVQIDFGVGDAVHPLIPSWASEITSFTPRKPRRVSERRKLVQNGSASEGPIAIPSTSRTPSVLTATAIITATDTIRPASRTFRYVASIHR